MIIDEELEKTHMDISLEVEEKLDKAIVRKKLYSYHLDPDLVELCYTNIQSGE